MNSSSSGHNESFIRRKESPSFVVVERDVLIQPKSQMESLEREADFMRTLERNLLVSFPRISINYAALISEATLNIMISTTGANLFIFYLLDG